MEKYVIKRNGKYKPFIEYKLQDAVPKVLPVFQYHATAQFIKKY